MPLSSNYAIDQLLLPAVVMFFLVWGVIGAAVGTGLIVGSESMFRLFGVLNRYVSTRHGLKPLAMAHDIGQSVRRHRRLVGAVIMLATAYSLYGLAAWFDNAAIVDTLNLGYPPLFVAWIVESVRWYLILTSVMAFAVGVMLVCLPDALDRIEARANRWYSVRKHTVGADTMVLTIDNFVETFPRSTGLVIVLAGIYVAAHAALLWVRFH